VKTLLIDADSEVYAAAAAAESRRVVGLLDNGALCGPFASIKELTANLGKHAATVLFRSREVTPEDGACLLLDARLRRLIQQATERYGEVKPELHLSGKVNYRHLIDPTYKGNRDSVEKPYYLARLRKHAQEVWGARVTRTWEADDEVGIRAFELGPSAVIASIDKDLRQIPGDHMILGKGHLHVTQRGALMRLYCQILAGDATDNVRGCWQVGYEGAFTYLEPFIDAGERALWHAVVAKYQAHLDKYGSEKCGFIDARGAALHTAQLVYILRDRPEGQIPPRWRPPAEE
jgi:hypothetical protein